MTIKSLERKIKKCNADEMAYRTKVKNCYKSNDLETARIHAVTSIRYRNQSRYYQMLNARLNPMADQLKSELSGQISTLNFNEMLNIIQDINCFEQKPNANELLATQIEIKPNDVDNLMQQLNGEITLEISSKMPTTIDLSIEQSNQQLELEQRLANLRHRRP